MATPALSLYDQAKTTTTGSIPLPATVPMSSQNVAAATATGSMSTTPTMSSAGIGGMTSGAQPTGTLPMPQMSNNLSPTGNTTALPGGNTAATQTVQSQAPLLSASGGAILPQGPMPLPTITQMLNTPVPATTDLSKYGSQGTTPAPPTDTSSKFIDLHAGLKGTESTSTNPMRTDEMQQKLADNTQAPEEDAQKNYIDNLMSMNPAVKAIYDASNEATSHQATQQTFEQEYQTLRQTQGIDGLNTQLMNVNNIMKGTEDDIRNEITKAGGFATESQVQALTAARNKTFIAQAANLENQIKSKEDYIDKMMQFSQLDRAAVEKQVDKQLGLKEKSAALTDTMLKSAKEAYQKVIDIAGYSGFAKMLQQTPHMIGPIEEQLGLPKGTLTNLQFLTSLDEKKNASKTGTWSDPYSLGGSLVQKNSLSGEVRTAVHLSNPKTSSSSTKSPSFAFTPTIKTSLLGAGETAASVSQLQKDIAAHGAQYVLDNAQGLSPASEKVLETTFGIQKTKPAGTGSSWWEKLLNTI